jgi:hypothetical protein
VGGFNIIKFNIIPISLRLQEVLTACPKVNIGFQIHVANSIPEQGLLTTQLLDLITVQRFYFILCYVSSCFYFLTKSKLLNNVQSVAIYCLPTM